MKSLLSAALLAASIAIAANAAADPEAATKPAYDQLVTPDVVFGSGNANGGFTTETSNGIEVGLRAKVRFPMPLNVFNSNGDGTYAFSAGDACPGFGFAGPPLCLATPLWSFEWHVNTDVNGATGATVGDFVYEIGLDADPSRKTDFTVFDPVTPSLIAPVFDHAFGLNGTANGDGAVAGDPAAYVAHLGQYNVVQNSWNYEFFNNPGTSLAGFDPAVDGSYVIYLKVKDPDKGSTLAHVQIEVIAGNSSGRTGKKQF